ncbi:MAG: sigma-70 family RNA polymerase sigma factor [Proteobacteria bacterium]|nr:sigma-70 family RNA polymerase sigma factor [Pseudomonadota bacterium]
MRKLFQKSSAQLQFEADCTAHLDALYASALKLTRNREDAEELVQDVYVRAFRFAKGFAPGTNLKAWLFRILINTFINAYRRKGHERRYIERAAVEPIYDDVLNAQARAYASDPENHLLRTFFARDLEDALAELPEEYRMPVILCDMQEFSYREIADMLGCPIGTVMSRLHRGRKMLQRELADHAIAAGLSVGDDKSDGKDKGDGKDRGDVLTDMRSWRQRQKGAS